MQDRGTGTSADEEPAPSDAHEVSPSDTQEVDCKETMAETQEMKLLKLEGEKQTTAEHGHDTSVQRVAPQPRALPVASHQTDISECGREALKYSD